jgi:hypothetical protein
MTELAEQPREQESDEAGEAPFAAGPIAQWYGLLVAACILAGALVRAFHVLSFDFPLNDGGLFFTMTRDLQDAGYRLPAFTSYNGGDIPFAYPPFGFYFAGLLDDLTPLSLLDVYRFLPWLAASLTVPAFYLLARSLAGSKAAVMASVFAFALIPRGYIWLLMGGGLTRSLGFLFALLALYYVYRVYKEEKQPAVALATLFCGLTVLSHLETAWFLAFSAAIFFVAFGRTRQAVVNSAIIAAGTVVIAAPWWATVLAEHGADPFLAAAGTGGTILSGGDATRGAYLGLLRFVSTSEPLFPILGTLALFGGLACIVSRRYFVVVWWAAIVVLEVRAFPTFTTVPVAMLAGIGVTEVLLPLLFKQPAATPAPAEEQSPDGETSGSRGSRRRSLHGRVPVFAAIPLAVLVVLIVYTGSAAMLRSRVLASEGLILAGLSGDDRAAMAWVAGAVPDGSRFLVVPDSPFWEVSKTAEWFPALTGLTSVSTVQGSEWISDDGFRRAQAIHHDTFECRYQTTACLEEMAEVHDVTFSHVYVPEDNTCCETLADSLGADPEYRLLYRGPASAVFIRATAD